MTLELLIAPLNYSSWSVRPWLVMTHFDIPFETTIAPTHTAEGKAVILDWSGAGRVPVLRDGDLTIWDSLAIIEYLAEAHPQLPIWPDQAAARATARSCVAEMHSGFSDVRNEMPMNARQHVPGLSFSVGAMGDVERLCSLWRACRTQWGANGPFLFGDFSAADAFFAPVVSRFLTYGIALDAECAAYADALMALPAVKAWYTIAKSEPWTIAHYELG